MECDVDSSRVVVTISLPSTVLLCLTRLIPVDDLHTAQSESRTDAHQSLRNPHPQPANNLPRPACIQTPHPACLSRHTLRTANQSYAVQQASLLLDSELSHQPCTKPNCTVHARPRVHPWQCRRLANAEGRHAPPAVQPPAILCLSSCCNTTSLKHIAKPYKAAITNIAMTL
jgi:hypothetical protein